MHDNSKYKCGRFAHTADAGAEATNDCSNTSVSIGTPAMAGNIYPWSPNRGGINPTSAITTVSDLCSTQLYPLTVTNAAAFERRN
ncbi:MAG: hypothetical protein IPN94_25615 [Sphingobacteriales bacterium]|nr:hypothetical protein [Sphingobacteriales bacterium]